MLANALDCEDRDAVEYAFVAYKYIAKAHKRLFKKSFAIISDELKVIINGL